MSDKISLTDLRKAATFDSIAQGRASMVVTQDVLLALIDAAESAVEVMRELGFNPANDEPEYHRLHESLARFAS